MNTAAAAVTTTPSSSSAASASVTTYSRALQLTISNRGARACTRAPVYSLLTLFKAVD